jgi:HK97 gp10 family phage protein
MPRLVGRPRQLGARGGVGANVRILGVSRALAKLGLVSKVARLEMGLLAAGAANHMFQRAQFYCPTITGNLRSGINLTKLGAYTYQITASSREGTNPAKNDKEYAGFVEYGTSKMGGRFFMRRAYEETRPLVASDLILIARKLEAL